MVQPRRGDAPRARRAPAVAASRAGCTLTATSRSRRSSRRQPHDAEAARARGGAPGGSGRARAGRVAAPGAERWRSRRLRRRSLTGLRWFARRDAFLLAGARHPSRAATGRSGGHTATRRKRFPLGAILSFFDEADEPTQSPRAQRALAAPPRGGGPRRPIPDRAHRARRDRRSARCVIVADPARRAASRAASTAARSNALKDYNRDVTALIQRVRQQVGKPFFDAHGAAARADRRTSRSQVNQLRSPPRTTSSAPRALDVPGDMKRRPAQPRLVLQLRADGPAARSPTDPDGARPRPDRRRPRSTRSPARCRRSSPPTSSTPSASRRSSRRRSTTNGITRPDDRRQPASCRRSSWLDARPRSPPRSAHRRAAPRSTRRRRRPACTATASTSRRSAASTLQPEAPACQPRAGRAEPTFTVKFTNQGQNDETNVSVRSRSPAPASPSRSDQDASARPRPARRRR